MTFIFDVSYLEIILNLDFIFFIMGFNKIYINQKIIIKIKNKK